MASGFADREAAGRELAQRLTHLRDLGAPAAPAGQPPAPAGEAGPTVAAAAGTPAAPAGQPPAPAGEARPTAAPAAGTPAATAGQPTAPAGEAGPTVAAAAGTPAASAGDGGPVVGGGVVVLGLPRGGVPVAAQVARALSAPLDVIVVRKLGLPWQPELAMGAIGEDGAMVLNEDIARAISQADLDRVVARERAELARRVQLWRGSRERVPLAGRTVVVVDDGVATGATAAAACAVARHAGAARVVLATPVAPPEVVRMLGAHADEVVAVLTPSVFRAVGQWYADFTPTPDEEVTRLLSA